MNSDDQEPQATTQSPIDDCFVDSPILSILTDCPHEMDTVELEQYVRNLRELRAPQKLAAGLKERPVDQTTKRKVTKAEDILSRYNL